MTQELTSPKLLSPQAIADLRIILNKETNNYQPVVDFTDAEVSEFGFLALGLFEQHLRLHSEEEETECTPVGEPYVLPETNYAVDMANRLKQVREARGLTQMEVAALIGHKSNNRISRWEKGLAKPDVNNALKLSKVLRQDIRKLFYPEE
jgi:DNA-binding XRE family transcriptional regulator